MPKFDDLLNSLGVAEDGISTVYPETFVDDIRAAYADDFSIPDARIQVLESDLKAANAEILALKAHNYELMVSAPANESGVDADESDPDNGEDNDDDEPRGVDALFTEKKDEN